LPLPRGPFQKNYLTTQTFQATFNVQTITRKKIGLKL